MGNKKNPSRFTIQFDGTDPRHVEVFKLLNGKGRKIAQYLTNAVIAYEGRSDVSNVVITQIRDSEHEDSSQESDNNFILHSEQLPNVNKEAIVNSLNTFRNNTVGEGLKGKTIKEDK